jgi:hypothetical protein
MAFLVVAEIFVTDGARRDEPICARFMQFHEQAGTGDAGDAAVERGADTIDEEIRDQPVVGLPLGQHGAAFGRGNPGGDFT